MSEPFKVFLPIRKPFIIFLMVIGCIVAANAYAITVYGGFFLWISFLLVSFIFIFVLYSVIRHPLLVISGEIIDLVSLTKVYRVNFSEDLFEVVELNDRIVSYRFYCDSLRLQISPSTYIDYIEMRDHFEKIRRMNKVVVPVTGLW